MSTQQQELPSATNWLTGEREDPVWMAYGQHYKWNKLIEPVDN